MNRNEALAWCVRELKEWPEHGHCPKAPGDWCWIQAADKTMRLTAEGDASIRKEEWISVKGSSSTSTPITNIRVPSKKTSDEMFPKRTKAEIEKSARAFVYYGKDKPSMSTAHPTAPSILSEAAAAVGDRAVERDTPEGERSMGKTVAAFNAMFSHALTEEQGWQFMELLKMARSAGGKFRLDDYTDGAAYAALAGEAAARERA